MTHEYQSRISHLRLVKREALNQRPPDIVTAAEISVEIQRIELGRPSSRLDPVTQAYVDTILGQNRGRDRQGRPLFRPS